MPVIVGLLRKRSDGNLSPKRKALLDDEIKVLLATFPEDERPRAFEIALREAGVERSDVDRVPKNDLPHLDIHGFARDPRTPTTCGPTRRRRGPRELRRRHHWQEVHPDGVLFLQAVAATPSGLYGPMTAAARGRRPRSQSSRSRRGDGGRSDASGGWSLRLLLPIGGWRAILARALDPMPVAGVHVRLLTCARPPRAAAGRLSRAGKWSARCRSVRQARASGRAAGGSAPPARSVGRDHVDARRRSTRAGHGSRPTPGA